MALQVFDFDEVILGILEDCREVEPPLDRHEIARHVLDHLGDTIHEHVFASLERLKLRNLVHSDAASGALDPIRFWLAKTTAQS